MRRRRSQTRQNFNKQEREVRRERCPAQTSVTCDGSRRTPSFFALHACELELTREAPAAALDRSRSHRRRSRSFLQALVRRAPLRSPLCRRLAFHALCSSLRSSLRSLRHRRPRPRLAPRNSRIFDGKEAAADSLWDKAGFLASFWAFVSHPFKRVPLFLISRIGLLFATPSDWIFLFFLTFCWLFLF